MAHRNAESKISPRPFNETTPFSRFMGKFAVHLFMWGAVLIVFVPLLVIIIGSFKTNKEYFNTGVFDLPSQFNLTNYSEAFFGGKVLLGLKNTAIIMVASCAGTIITGTMTAFVLQRFSTLFSRAVKVLFLLATLLPSISMQVTVFQIVNRLGLYDSLLAPIVLYIGTDIISISIFIQFLNNISVSLDESAIIDGASYPQIYFRIILPNLLPAIATVLIIKFVSIYNDFYTAQLYMPSTEHGVVSTALYRFIGPYGARWEIIFAGIIICIIPTLVMFLSLQRYIYSGLVSGSVKE